MTTPRELFVEEQAVRYFVEGGRGAMLANEIDLSERASSVEVVLLRRLKSMLQKLNLNMPAETINEVVRILSRPPIVTTCLHFGGKVNANERI